MPRLEGNPASSPTDDDVEGHVHTSSRASVTDEQDDDVEGHGHTLSRASITDEQDDVEGHRRA